MNTINEVMKRLSEGIGPSTLELDEIIAYQRAHLERLSAGEKDDEATVQEEEEYRAAKKVMQESGMIKKPAPFIRRA